MKRRLKLFFIIGITICSFLSQGEKTYAVQIYPASKESEIPAGQSFEVQVYINTENEEINAIEGKIKIPSDLVVLQDIREANSFISFWIEKPQKNKENDIIFSGIMPGGYNRDKGLLFSLLLQAKQKGKGAITPYDVMTLLNDGEATETATKKLIFPFTITQQKKPEQEKSNSFQDADLPEAFTPVITQHKDMADGKQCVIFSTTDKGTGIDYYEVLETKEDTLQGGEWHRAASPYILEDQELKSCIYVKAVDKAGNQRIEILHPPSKNFSFDFIIGLFILLGGITLAAIMIVIGRYKACKRKKNTEYS